MKKSVLLLAVFCSVTVFNLFSIPVFAQESSYVIDRNPDFQVYSANIEWKYKTENGQLYRRQYDLTTQKWIGSWELCP